MLSKREKEIVASYYHSEDLSSRKEVRKSKLKAMGHYWHDHRFYQFVAVSKKGVKKYLIYCHHPKESGYEHCCSNVNNKLNYHNVSKQARLWARGDING